MYGSTIIHHVEFPRVFVNSGRHREVFADAFQRQKVEFWGWKGVAFTEPKAGYLEDHLAHLEGD